MGKNRRSRMEWGGTGSQRLDDELLQRLETNRNMSLNTMERSGDWVDELPYIREALKDSPYVISGIKTGEGGNDTITLQHVGYGDDSNFRIEMKRSAIRSLSFNSDEGLPDLKSILKAIDKNTEFRQGNNSLVLDYLPEHTFSRRGFNDYTFDVSYLDGVNQKEFDSVMDTLFNGLSNDDYNYYIDGA